MSLLLFAVLLHNFVLDVLIHADVGYVMRSL